MSAYAVIMAGGSGTRLWPLSRAKKPKFLLAPQKKTFLDQTLDRFSSVIPQKNRWVVCGKSHLSEILKTSRSLSKKQILCEPLPRNTAPCIGWAALMIAGKDPEAVMVVSPADHYIPQKSEKRFQQIIRTALDYASQRDTLITIGIVPTKPHTGFGYIEKGPAQAKDLFQVKRFVEKPPLAQAKKYVSSKRFFWNGGLFVGKARVFLSEIRRYMPDLYVGLRKIQDGAKVEKVFPTLPAESIDYGVMEKSKIVSVVPGNFEWHDVGDVRDFLKIAGGGFIYKDTLKVIATLGLEDLIIVESEGALLVAHPDQAQNVRQVVEALKKIAPQYL